MSRRDSHRSSTEEISKKWSRLADLWSYKFSSGFTQEFLPDIPSPIMANDMVIVPDPGLQSFIGIGTNDGHGLGSPKILGGRLSYASTPVYVNPFLIFALNGALYQICFDEDGLSSNLILSDSRIQLVDYCAPVATEEVTIFGLRKWILIYKPKTGEAEFIPYKFRRKDDHLLSPVQWEKEAVFLSRFGQILRAAFDENKPDKDNLSIEEIGELGGNICSTPCLLEDRIYFEVLALKGLRRSICEYSLSGNGPLGIEGLEEGICSPMDTRLYFPFLVFQRGIILSSDLGPRLYYVQGGDPIKVTPIDIKIKKDNLKIYQISHIFASILGSRLIGKIPKGFFSVDLLHPEEGTIDIFRPETELIGQPINSGCRLFFMTRTGVRCYAAR